MNTDVDFSMWLALMCCSHVLAEGFRAATGMTLEEWDELNYQRVMMSDDRSPA